MVFFSLYNIMSLKNNNRCMFKIPPHSYLFNLPGKKGGKEEGEGVNPPQQVISSNIVILKILGKGYALYY